jgi:ribosomal protein S18 acetylase RimI-like enzyme
MKKVKSAPPDTDRPGSRIVIRDARPEELESVARLLKKSYEQYASSMPARSWKMYLEDIMDVRGRLDSSQLIVATVGDKLAGAVTLYLDKAIPEETGWPAGWSSVRLLGVDPQYRGHGIGRALMEECMKRSREHGFHTIGLHTTLMMDVARRMYERMGFVRVPEHDYHPAPDVIVMAYKLDL